jgi:hypothetical protein
MPQLILHLHHTHTHKVLCLWGNQNHIEGYDNDDAIGGATFSYLDLGTETMAKSNSDGALVQTFGYKQLTAPPRQSKRTTRVRALEDDLVNNLPGSCSVCLGHQNIVLVD